MILSLPDLQATRALGAALADLLRTWPTPLPVLFHGDLGSGKTTLVAALVAALPGGELAEVSSPSFTVCNMYPTDPPIAHFDLYRQDDGTVDESLLDFLDGERHVVLVEWAERLPAQVLPPIRLTCELRAEGNDRVSTLTASSPELERRLADLLPCAVISRDNP